MKKSKPNPKANKSILWFAYGVVALFLLMGAYMGYFIQAESEEVINNPYNSRLDSLSDRIIRGKILSSDGTVLAETSGARRESIRTANCLPMWLGTRRPGRRELSRWQISTS